MNGKTVLVAGAISGVGEADAYALAGMEARFFCAGSRSIEVRGGVIDGVGGNRRAM
jgi:NADP-dependent 3-hydroxy acid dehydrogenase YdfG